MMTMMTMMIIIITFSPTSTKSQALDIVASKVWLIYTGHVSEPKRRKKLKEYTRLTIIDSNRLFPAGDVLFSVAMKQLCDTMKWQILSRAFYGCEFGFVSWALLLCYSDF